METVSHNGLDTEVYNLRPADYTTTTTILVYYCTRNRRRRDSTSDVRRRVSARYDGLKVVGLKVWSQKKLKRFKKELPN